MTTPASASSRQRSSNLSDERSRAALLLVDVINRFEFPGNKALIRAAFPAARAISRLKRRARAAQMPVVYANDNFGRWRSDFRAIVESCRGAEVGDEVQAIAECLAPNEDDYFVLKPNNSGFYATVLETLLRYLGVQTLVLAGFATDNRVLFTAHDAYLRGFQLVVPPDCVAAESSARQTSALRLMSQTMKAQVPLSRSIVPAKLVSRP